MLVILDAGHGGLDRDGQPTTPGKRSPDGMLEHEFNSRVADVMKAELEKYEGVRVVFTHETYRDVPLDERTDKANELDADVFVSLHANAYLGKMGDWSGIDTFVHTTNPEEARELAEVMQRSLIDATGLRDRGVKTANFHVLRETEMTAVLVEHGFMDSVIDLPKLKSDEYRVLCGETNAKSLAEFYGLKPEKVEVVPARDKEVKTEVVKARMLERGDTGADVSAVQSKLKAFGFYVGNVDGIFGPISESSVKSFQTATKIEVDGIVGPQTYIALETYKPASKPSPKYDLPARILKRGDTGADVKLLQIALKAAKFDPKGIDGDFGPKTEGAVKRFQSVYLPYEVDGVYGPNTRKKLAEVLR